MLFMFQRHCGKFNTRIESAKPENKLIGRKPHGFDKPRSFDRLTTLGPFDRLRANGP
jgi:hypothetical protein